MQPLPRQLWELRGSRGRTSELMLRMLHRAGVFAQAGRPISAALQRLQDQLMPCFLLVQPLRQPKKAKHGAPGTRAKIAAGPLACLPSASQVTLPGTQGLCLVPVSSQHISVFSLGRWTPYPR